jgi:hypothetical protein
MLCLNSSIVSNAAQRFALKLQAYSVPRLKFILPLIGIGASSSLGAPLPERLAASSAGWAARDFGLPVADSTGVGWT